MQLFDAAATGAAAFLTLPCVVGFGFMVVAFENNDSISPTKRYIALYIANVCLMGSLISAFIYQDVSIIDLWQAGNTWWLMDDGPMDKVIAMVTWATLVSPVLSLITFIRIRKARRRKARYRTTFQTV